MRFQAVPRRINASFDGTRLAASTQREDLSSSFGTPGVTLHVLGDLLLLTYAATIGFVAAGVTASFYKMVTSQPARFGPAGHGSLAWFSAFCLGALAGPIIILQTARERVREGTVPRSMLAAGVLIAGLWSGCLGILVLEVALNVRDSLA